MNKNITIALLSISLLLSLAFGFYQRAEALRNKELAVENARLADEMEKKAQLQMKLAEEQRHMAEVNAMEALKQRQIAQEAAKRKK